MIKQTLLLLFVILSFYNKAIFAQKTKADSLILQLKAASIDTAKVEILIKLSDELGESKPFEGEAYSKQALQIAQKINYDQGIADAYYHLGYYDLDHSKYNEALVKFRNAMSVYIKLKSLKDQVYVYYGIGSALQYKNQHDSALNTYKHALDLSNRIEDQKLIAHSNYYIGGAYHALGQNKQALKHELKAHAYYKENGLMEDDWYALNDLGIIHDEMGMYVEALNYNLEALEISQMLMNKQGEIIIANNIAVLYNTLHNNAEALNYYESAYETSKIIGDMDMESTLLGNMAGIMAEEGDTITSFLYTRMALKIQLENNFTCTLPYSYEGLGDLYIGRNMLDSAIYYLKKAEQIGSDCGDLAMKTSVCRNLGIAYKKSGNYKLAEELMVKSLKIAQKSFYKNEEREAALELYRFYKQRKNDRKALNYHELYQSISDSIFNIESNEKIGQLTAEYEFRKEKKLIELENEKELLTKEAQIENQTQIRNGVLLALFISIVFLIIFYQSYIYIKLQNSKLRALNNEKNTLMGILAHDLRNPLNNIKTIIPIMKEDSPEAKESMSEFVDMIGETTDRMYDMVDKILDVNAVEEMKVKLDMKVTDLGSTVLKICEAFETTADRKNISLDCKVEKDRHYSKVDQNYLLQIIENLVSNALKFLSPNDRVRLSIESTKDTEQIIVEDSGPGIDRSEQEKLFKKYEKISNEPTAGESSNGLGLSIVKKYVDAMSGSILCESILGEGTKFIVSFAKYNPKS